MCGINLITVSLVCFRCSLLLLNTWYHHRHQTYTPCMFCASRIASKLADFTVIKFMVWGGLWWSANVAISPAETAHDSCAHGYPPGSPHARTRPFTPIQVRLTHGQVPNCSWELPHIVHVHICLSCCQ